ncbi:TPA: hypothetical protein DD394_05385 [bacterium UBP9_UBA11836]|nr:hypothetical protein [bacterium UBP9_UBA11836]
MKKTGDVDSSLCSDLRSLSRAMTRLYNTLMPKVSVERTRRSSNNTATAFRVELPIRVTQVAVLEALEDLSWCDSEHYQEARDGVSQVELAKHLGVDTATMCRNMRVLVQENSWAEEKKNGKSERGKLLKISESGRRALQEARPVIKKLNSEIIDRISQQGIDIQKLSADLKVVAEIVASMEELAQSQKSE